MNIDEKQLLNLLSTVRRYLTKTFSTGKSFGKANLLWMIILASTTLSIANDTGDSTNFLTAKDTIFINFEDFKEKIFVHTIEKKQTLYSLAKFYGLSMNDLYYYNTSLKDAVVSIGTAVKVPIPNRVIKRYKWSAFDPMQYIPICYRVKSGDNLYRIAKYHFKMSLDTVMTRNQLMNTTLKVGQVLHLGWMSIKGIPQKYQQAKGSAKEKHNYYLQQKFLRSGNGRKLNEQQGIAYWQREGQQRSGLFALHRKARINSIIAVTNPMNNRTVYAKVIGRLPSNVYDENINVVVSKTVAQQLGAKDPRFFVKTSFFR